MSVSISISAETADAEKLLRSAHQLVVDKFGTDQPLVQAALHLIDCATDAVAVLPCGDLEAARLAVGSARAAVGAATYAVRRVHDEKGTGRT
jgi:hypothetical protein